MIPRVASAVAAAVGVGVAVYWWRGYHPSHAAFLGLAIGALVYTAFGTARRLGWIWGRRRR